MCCRFVLKNNENDFTVKGSCFVDDKVFYGDINLERFPKDEFWWDHILRISMGIIPLKALIMFRERLAPLLW